MNCVVCGKDCKPIFPIPRTEIKIGLCDEHNRQSNFGSGKKEAVRRLAQMEFKKTHSRQDLICLVGRDYLGT